ncbi:MAG: CHAT domain-containing protein [Nostoc sp.]|uniref:CHAT domain-containing protein n=1 Tax=Nostoc sp. TaxID=1180 RepID=UPI002FF910A5
MLLLCPTVANLCDVACLIRIIYFATHGIFNSKHPKLSGVVLWLFDDKGMPQNGFLRSHDVFNLCKQNC